jgi:hypothetical protein
MNTGVTRTDENGDVWVYSTHRNKGRWVRVQDPPETYSPAEVLALGIIGLVLCAPIYWIAVTFFQ